MEPTCTGPLHCLHLLVPVMGVCDTGHGYKVHKTTFTKYKVYAWGLTSEGLHLGLKSCLLSQSCP